MPGGSIDASAALYDLEVPHCIWGYLFQIKETVSKFIAPGSWCMVFKGSGLFG